MSLTVLLNHKLYNYKILEHIPTTDEIVIGQVVSRIIYEVLHTIDFPYTHLSETFITELNEILETTDNIDRNVISQRLISDIFNTRDNIKINIGIHRMIVDNFNFNDFIHAILEPAFLPLPFDLEERVEFIYQNALCEGTIVEILEDPVYRIIVEVDSCSNYLVMPDDGNRVELDIQQYHIKKIRNNMENY